MSILTAVPFALAIRDTARDPEPPVIEPEPEARIEIAPVEPRDEEVASREARRDAQRAVLRHLYVNDADFLWNDKVEQPGIIVHYALEGTRVEVTDELLCDELDRELVDEWGPGRVEGDGRQWLDPPGFTGQRIEELDGGCTLVYDLHYVQVGAMVTAAPDAVVPVSAIGMRGDVLVAHLTERQIAVHRLGVGEDFGWSAPGLGAGRGQTELKTVVKRGVVVELFASGTATDATLDELEASITASFGPSILEASTEHVSWASTPPIALVRAATGYTILVGRPTRR